jgi:hypothetical protein
MPDFLPKQQLGVQGIPAKRVQDLGADIMNLFGNVGKAVKTYDTIGETSAILEFQEQSIQASDRLTEQKILLNRAAEMNDVETMTAVKANIDAITTDVLSKRDNFSNHKAAYEAYNSRASDFGARVRSTYHPSVDAAIVRSTKANRVSYNNNIMNKYAESSMPISTASFSDSQKINKDSYFSEQEQQAFKSQVFTHNASLLSSALTSAPEEMVNKYSLLSPDKGGNLKYSYKNEKVMLDEVFGDAYTVDDAGMVVPTKSNTAPDAQEMAMLSGTLKRFRSMFATENGDAYSAAFDSDYSEVKDLLSSIEGGNTQFGSISSNTAVANIMSGKYNSQLSKGQKKKLQVLMIDMGKSQNRYNTVVSTVNQLVQDGDMEAIQKLSIYGLNEKGMNIPANQFKAHLENATTTIDNTLTNAFASSTEEVDQNMPQIVSMAKQYYTLTGGQTASFIKESERNINDGSSYSPDPSSLEKSLKVKLALMEDGKGVGINTQGSIKKKKIEQHLDRIRQAKQTYKDDPIRLVSAMNAIAAQGQSEKAFEIERVYKSMYNVNMGELTDSIWNLGESKDLSQSDRESIAAHLVENGYYPKTTEDFKDALDELYERKSSFFGSAYYVPKSMSDTEFEALRTDITEIANESAARIYNASADKTKAKKEVYKENQEGFAYSFMLGMDGLEETYIVKMFDDKKNEVASRVYSKDELSALRDKKFKIMQPTDNATSIKADFTTITEGE